MTTTTATKEYGWTCSQPLDKIDGYDPLSTSGRKMIQQVLRQHRPFLVLLAFDCRIWSLLTNLSPGLDWAKLRYTVGRALELGCGRLSGTTPAWTLLPAREPGWLLCVAVQGHLGQVGQECRREVCDWRSVSVWEAGCFHRMQKRTGWMSNIGPILNAVGRRCSCPAGAREVVIGGKKSGEAAAYPAGLCRAICRGVRDTMNLD